MTTLSVMIKRNDDGGPDLLTKQRYSVTVAFSTGKSEEIRNWRRENVT